MPSPKRRELAEEAAKHFQGAPASRVRTARRLGRRALELFRATLPAGTSLREARRLLAISKHHGRRRSRAIEALHLMSLVGDVIAYLGTRRVKCALIGGQALAVHGVARATLDADLLVASLDVLRDPFWAKLSPHATVDIQSGDRDDPLAGAIRIRRRAEQTDVIVGRAWVRRMLDRTSSRRGAFARTARRRPDRSSYVSG